MVKEEAIPSRHPQRPYQSLEPFPNSHPGEALIPTFSPPRRTRLSAFTGLRRRWLCGEACLQPSEGNLIAPWGIHWHTPVAVVCLLILSISTAVVHHTYYRNLHRSRADSLDGQRWVSRIGTGLAFLFQTSVVAVLQLSRKQYVWLILRASAMTLQGIDDLFGVTSNPLLFRHKEMYSQAPLATVMAIITWVIPMTVVFAPSSITVKVMQDRAYLPCSAPTVRYMVDSESTAELLPVGYPLVLRHDGVYYGPTDAARNAFATGAFNWNMTQSWDGIEGCSMTGECKYSHTPVLPSVNCSVEDTYDTLLSSWQLPGPWLSFFSDIPNHAQGYPVFLSQRDNHNRNTLWITHTQQLNGTRDGTMRLSLISCRNSISQFYIDMVYSNGFLYAYDDTLNFDHVAFLDDLIENSTSKVESSNDYQYDVNLVLFDLTVAFLEGSVFANVTDIQSISSTRRPIITLTTNRTSIGSTMEYGETLLNKTGQELADGIFWSSFSMATMPIYFYAVEGAAQVNTTCHYSEDYIGYHYSYIQLLITYTSITLVAIVIASLGFSALAMNGVSSDVNFSTILLTTRNPELDEAVKGGCIGGSPLPERMKGLKMRFGAIGSPDARVQHLAFGLEQKGTEINMVREIKRSGLYS